MLDREAVTVTPQEAFRYCERLARSHYENFTVGSWLLPRDKLPHVFNIYAYCRTVDDLGDEIDSDGLEALDRWEEELRLCYAGSPHHPVMVALKETVKAFDIPKEPFLKLIEANRIDQRQRRFPTYDDLLHYCDHSANPVGHLLLYLFGYRDPERQRLADKTCTALQLTNCWQDIGGDYEEMGRIYIPLEDMQRFGYTEEELGQGVVNNRFVALMSFEVGRARQLFREGAALVRTVRGRLRIDMRLFTEGGLSILKGIEKAEYDIFRRRLVLTPRNKVRLFLFALIREGIGLLR